MPDIPRTANKFYTPPGTEQPTVKRGPPANPMQQLNLLAKMLDEHLNGVGVKANSRRNGFILLAYPFGGKATYLSNTDRRQALDLLKAQVAKFEDQFAEEERKRNAEAEAKSEKVETKNRTEDHV